MACNPLIQLAKECGKNSASGLRNDVYLVPFSELTSVSGSTEVYNTSVSGLVNQISFTSGSTKFVKYGTVKDQNSFTETFTYNEGGSYDFQKELTFTIGNVGSTASKNAVENLINNPVLALVKMKTGQWLLFGQNGLFQMTASAGEVGSAANQRVITLAGSDTEGVLPVDPTVVTSFLAA